MDNIIRFPKEKIKFANTIQEAFNNKDYKFVISNKQEIIDNANIYLDTKTIDILVESYFESGYFDDVVTIYDELIKKDIESFDMIYHTLLSYLSYMDIYQARSLIKRSKLLNNELIKQFYINDGANYTAVINLNDKQFNQMGYCLIIVIFIVELSKEMINTLSIDSRYVFLRYFDMVNTVYELSGDTDLAQELARVLNRLFQIEV